MAVDRRSRGLVPACVALLVAAGAGGCNPAAPVPSSAPSTARTAAPEFGYSGDTGPERWGALEPDWALCAAGRRQSPIDLGPGVRADLPDPAFAWVAGQATVTDAGHSIVIAPAAGSTMTVDGTPWSLAQFHFHSPAEHADAGDIPAVEWHFVHRSPAGSLAVVALHVESGPPSAAWQPVVDAVVAAAEDGIGTSIERLDLAPMLPTRLATIRYEGSLTTPPCTEGVRWFVLAERLTMSVEQIDALRGRYAGNARPIQERNDRPIRDDEADH